jgi:putative restriction endonuclease
MLNPETSVRLRVQLIDTYFAPELRLLLLEQGDVNIEAYKYSRMLIRGAKEGIETWHPKEPPGKAHRVRNQGFRKAIVQLYEHRCALCGIRMLTPEGHTVVEAAHIKPWHESQDDRPTNGLCLCKLCHWSFDEGLMSINSEYQVLISQRVQTNSNLPGHIMTLVDRPIFRPEEDIFWPGLENMSWHQSHTFKN